MHIVLHQPEIPANTGNIGRTCVATRTSLHLIEPLGFRINEKELKRAGMDYWDELDVTRYVNFEEFRERHPDARLWMATTKAQQSYADVSFGPDDFIMFGRESAGIPEELLAQNRESCIRIPMAPDIRSLNLSNAVAIVLYEALRQNGFEGMQTKGSLHRLQYKSTFIAPGAVVLGDVTLGEDVSIWYHATVRGDRAPVTVGRGSNIQDNCVLHVGVGHPIVIGEYVTVGHGAIVHGSRVGDHSLIGMGAVLMNGSVVGQNCIVGAGALVTQNMVIPDNSVALGSPARVVRQVTEEETAAGLGNAELYIREAREAGDGESRAARL